MYKLISFNEVSANFTAHFQLSISAYFDRNSSNSTGKLHFITHKFVRHLVRNYGFDKAETLESFVCRRYSVQAWTFLKRLM